MSSVVMSAASMATAPAAGLFFLYLSTSSLLAPVQAIRTTTSKSSHHVHPHRSNPSFYAPPTCPLNRNSCPATPSTGLRPFHSSAHTWKSAPSFGFYVAASYVAKGHRFDPQVNYYTREAHDENSISARDLGECVSKRPKRNRPRSGQDAFFFSQVGVTKTTAFGVADGVGGWVESGIDPADFSHGLCEYMACAARLWPRYSSDGVSLNPKDLLQLGYDEVIDDKSIIGGGSTACLAIADPDGSVEVANLGDSGFMHLGLNAVRHFTHPQTHAFNTPFQLSKTPHRMLVQMAVFGGPSTLSDPPKAANITHHKVRHGDVLVFATDGVWDNLSPQDVLGIVSHHMFDQGAWKEDQDGTMEISQSLAELTQANDVNHRADGSSLHAQLAIAIARGAKTASLDTRRDGPFAKEVQKQYPGENWHGGKPDDIAVVVAVVVEEDTE